MPTYTPPLTDIRYVLHDLLKVHEGDSPHAESLDPDFTEAVLSEAGKIASDVLAPLNAIGDQQGCRLENGKVVIPTGFDAALDTLRDGGWTGLDCDPEFGGQGLPNVLSMAVGEMFTASNMALMMYPGLTHGVYSALHSHGTPAQKATYLPKLVSFEWGGTMNLTEPHCGTDLGLLRTKAEPQPDGSYKVTGQKIFISSGDHEHVSNIIHLVLARLPDAPAGVKGISLFIVPKFLVNEDGTLGARNGVSVGSLEEKMGIHGNATCVLNYDGATGYLVGEPHKGLRAMFTMMNEARVVVGLQGLAQAQAAYGNAVTYAQDRLQGRAITGAANPDGPADPLIVHPDVRRSLMEQKAFIEGGRAFALWGATLIDQAQAGDAEADALVALLTPVIKGFLTDKGFDATVKAQQIFGGHGFIEEWGMSQYVRDARIPMIYEGTNGIQGMDLVGRKLPMDGGKPVMAFFGMVQEFLGTQETLQGYDTLGPQYFEPLGAALEQMQMAVGYFAKVGAKDPNAALSGASDFLHLMGHVCLGLMWAKMARCSYDALAAGAEDAAFHEAKLKTGAFYMARLLPECGTHLARITSGADSVMGLSEEMF